MAITFDKHTRVFSLQTQNTTWQMQVSEYGHLLHLYYGRKISDTSLTYLIRGINRGFSGPPYEARNDRGYSLDTYPQEYSAFGAGDYRESCLHAEYEDGSQTTELRYLSHRIYLGKYRLPGLPSARADQGDGVQTLEIHLKDTASQVEVILYYGVLE